MALLALLTTITLADAAHAQAVDTLRLGLREAEQRALRNHPLLDRARADLQLSRARRTQASHARWLPNLNLRNVWGPIPQQRGEFTDTGVLVSPDTSTSIEDLRWFTQVDLQLTQPVYTFGKLGAIEDAAASGVAASRANLQGTRAEVRRQVRELYWGTVLGSELMAVADDVMDRMHEADTLLQRQYEEGEATQNDLFKFRIFQYRARKRRRQATGQLERARAGLRAVTGIDETRPLRLEDEDLEPLQVELDSLPRLMALARNRHPELARLRAGIAARRSQVDAVEADRWPRFFLGAEVTLNEAPSRFDPENPFWDDETNFFRPGIVAGFDWNLNFLHRRDEARVSRIEAERMAASLKPLALKVQEDVRAAYLRARRARRDLEGSREALQASENWFRAEMQTFEIGIGELQELIDAFQANVEMQIEHLRNISEYNTAVAELSQAVGVDLYDGR